MSDSLEIKLLFHVPEGLEYIAVDDLCESLSNKDIVRSASYTIEPKSGRIHAIFTVESLAILQAYIQSVRLHSVYTITHIVSECIIPSAIFEDRKATCDFITEKTEQSPWSLSGQHTFRATFKKGTVKHKQPSKQIAGYVGAAFGNVYPDWKVNLTAYDYEVMALWFQSSDAGMLEVLGANDQSVILVLGITIPIEDQKHRNRIHVGQTSLNPAIAYCLARLANPMPGDVVLDMCCGTGTIPIEGAAKFKNVFWIGSDVKMKTVMVKARENALHANLKNVEIMLGDGRNLCFRNGSIDIILADWPWGLRENSYSQIQGLYPKFMKAMWRALKPHGKAYIVSQGHKLMKRTLEYPWCVKMWSVETKCIGIGGYEVYLYILTRLDQ